MSLRFAILVLVLGRGLDIVTTYYSMKYVPELYETTPYFRKVVDSFGILGGNIFMFVFVVVILVALAYILEALQLSVGRDVWWIPSFVNGFTILIVTGTAFLTIGLNNLYLILTVS